MKNFVIATVSVFALLGATANAQEKAPEMKEGQKSAEMMADKKEANHKQGMHHHKHHAHKHHRGHMHGGHALAVYVNYPLLDVAAFSACQPEYYEGNQAHAYIWHEGYFWYPHANAELLAGYKPHSMHGAFWYPSRLHPHMVYIDKQTMMPHEIYPVQIGAGHRGAKHKHRAHHKGHMKKHHAKEKAMENNQNQEMPMEMGKPAPKQEMQK